MSAVEIVLKYSLIVVIYSVIVLGSNEVKSDGAQSNKTEIANTLNETGKLMTEAGVIPLEDGHTAPIKSRKRPPLKYYPNELAKSESSKSNFDWNTNMRFFCLPLTQQNNSKYLLYSRRN